MNGNYERLEESSTDVFELGTNYYSDGPGARLEHIVIVVKKDQEEIVTGNVCAVSELILRAWIFSVGKKR